MPEDAGLQEGAVQGGEAVARGVGGVRVVELEHCHVEAARLLVPVGILRSKGEGDCFPTGKLTKLELLLR